MKYVNKRHWTLQSLWKALQIKNALKHIILMNILFPSLLTQPKTFLNSGQKAYRNNAGSMCQATLLSSTIQQAWILAMDIRQCPAKNRVMSNENCLTTDKNVRCEVKENVYMLCLKTHKHSVSIDLSFSGFSFINILIDNFTDAVFLYSNP